MMTRSPPWPPHLSADDIDLWEQIKAQVKPLRRTGTTSLRSTLPTPLREVETQQKGQHSPQEKVPARKRSTPAPDILQKPLKRRIQRGHEPIAGRLDLHGMRQNEAHEALLAFLHGAQARGARIVLVITGKGGGSGNGHDDDGRGVLRRSVPQWLAARECRPLVAGFDVAGPRFGGTGALLVHVRRLRPEHF